MFSGGGLFGTGAAPINQQPMGQQGPLMGGPGGLFQQQPQQGGIMGQPLQQQQQQQQGGGLFQQPQQQQPTLFPQQQQVGGLFQQQGPSMFPQQQANQQQSAIQFQNYLPQGYIKQNIKNTQDMMEDLKRKKDRFPALMDELSATNQKQQLPQTYGPELAEKLKLTTEELSNDFKLLLGLQRDVAMRMDEYISTLGIIEKLTDDGTNAIRIDNSQFKELQNAEQTLKQSNQKIDYYSQDQRGTMSYYANENDYFNVPQHYHEQILQKAQKDVSLLGETINRLEYYFGSKIIKVFEYLLDGMNLEPIKDVDELVDQRLQEKLEQLQSMSYYLYLLMQKVKSIQSRVDNFRTKTFSHMYADKNKQLRDFHSIDLAKNQLESIVTQDL